MSTSAAASRGRPLLAADRLKSVHRGDPSTLKQLFLGELWRGRDNLRVSLAPAVVWTTLASAAIPVVSLLATAAAVVGVLWDRRLGIALSAAA